jgi:hypothetical protein
MPYKLRKSRNQEKYWVVNKKSGHKYSKRPLERSMAVRQMRALYASEKSGRSGMRIMGGLEGGDVDSFLMASFDRERGQLPNKIIKFLEPRNKENYEEYKTRFINFFLSQKYGLFQQDLPEKYRSNLPLFAEQYWRRYFNYYNQKL